MNRHFLNAKQERELLEHLRTHLDWYYSNWMLQEIDLLCAQVSKKEKGTPKQSRSANLVFQQWGDHSRQHRTPGRPTNPDQAELIRCLSDYYPDHFNRSAARTNGSRPRPTSNLFLKTVEIVLFYVYRKKLADPIDAIHRALSGHPVKNDRAAMIRAIWKGISPE